MTTSDYLKMTNIYISLQEKLHYKVAQIGYYNWLTYQEVDRVMENMNRHIVAPGELVYEQTIIDYEDEKKYKKMDEFVKQYIELPLRFNARVDAITDTTVWEFKCVDALEIEHLLQVIIYAWIWQLTHDDAPRVFKIMNIRTAEVRVLKYVSAEIDDIVSQIIESKYKKQIEIRDTEFIGRTKSLI
jgi:hypothetical protein